MTVLQGWNIQIMLATIGMIVADHIALDVGFALSGLVASFAVLSHYRGRH